MIHLSRPIDCNLKKKLSVMHQIKEISSLVKTSQNYDRPERTRTQLFRKLGWTRRSSGSPRSRPASPCKPPSSARNRISSPAPRRWSRRNAPSTCPGRPRRTPGTSAGAPCHAPAGTATRPSGKFWRGSGSCGCRRCWALAWRRGWRFCRSTWWCVATIPLNWLLAFRGKNNCLKSYLISIIWTFK